MRKLHIDFHNSPLIENIAAGFDQEEFADAVKASHADCLQVFAKCHHGMSYYDTKAGTRHPHLKFDLMGRQVETAQKLGIKASAYYSVCWDEDTAHKHPEWLQVDASGKPRAVSPVPYQGWAALCVNSAYVEELLLPQTGEILKNYGVCGIFYDILMVADGECLCGYCIARMKESGLAPENTEDRWKFSEQTVLNFITKISGFIRGIKPDAEIMYNNQVRIGNKKIVPYITNLDIEAVPTGLWGYHYFPFYVRYIRTWGVPFAGASTVHRNWADFGWFKSTDALKWEVATWIANGASCYMGDHAYPDCRLERSVYEQIGEAYKEVEEKEKYCIGAEPVVQIAVLADPEIARGGLGLPSSEALGAAKMLMELHHQFNVIDREDNFSGYEVIVLPDNRMLNAEAIARLKSFIKNGGRVLVTNLASFDEKRGRFLLDELGVTYAGLSPYSLDYIRPLKKISAGIAPMDYILYDRFVQVIPAQGSSVLARTVHPYFERTAEHFTSHFHSPPGDLSEYPAIVKNGNCIYVSAPVFKGYFENGNTAYPRIIGNCLDLLLPRKLIVTDAPSVVEVLLMRHGKRLIVHLINFIPQKRGEHIEVIDTIPSLHDINVSVLVVPALRKQASASSFSVSLAPSGKKLRFKADGENVSFTLPYLRVHEMAVIERL